MFAIFLAEEVAEVTLETQHKMIELWTQSDIFIKVTLLLTFFFSIASWAVIGMKYRQLKKVKKRSAQFLSSFWRAKTIELLLEKATFLRSPVFRIFKTGLAALKEHGESRDKERISYAIRKATDDEMESLESYVPFLATTASAAPFLGLFGTVWGIMKAFWKLGHAAGASSLEVVGPHIGEALSTTALGLIAAIPAVIFYNFFVSRINLINRDLNQFAGDLENRIEDEYLKAGGQKG